MLWKYVSCWCGMLFAGCHCCLTFIACGHLYEDILCNKFLSAWPVLKFLGSYWSEHSVWSFERPSVPPAGVMVGMCCYSFQGMQFLMLAFRRKWEARLVWMSVSPQTLWWSLPVMELLVNGSWRWVPRSGITALLKEAPEATGEPWSVKIIPASEALIRTCIRLHKSCLYISINHESMNMCLCIHLHYLPIIYLPTYYLLSMNSTFPLIPI